MQPAKWRQNQHSTVLKNFEAFGIQPNMIVLRSEYPVPQEMKDKIALFCNIKSEEWSKRLTRRRYTKYH